MGAIASIGGRQKALAGVALALMVLCVGVLWMAVGRGGAAQVPKYFTINEGETYFAAKARDLPPMEIDGKEAVQAMMFKGADGKMFVGYLLKYSDKAKELLVGTVGANGQAAEDPPNLASLMEHETFIKSPGVGNWTRMDDAGAAGILAVVDPKTKELAAQWVVK